MELRRIPCFDQGEGIFMRLAAILAALALALPACASAQAQQQLPTCDAAEHRALDFWVGEWDAVRADTMAPAGRSSIRIEDRGCVITEHWTSLNAPFSGRSLNLYNRASGQWEQFWADSTGARIYFVGGPIPDGLQMTADSGADGAQRYSRVTLIAREDGTVLQRGEASADGETWALTYAFIYRRRIEN